MTKLRGNMKKLLVVGVKLFVPTNLENNMKMLVDIGGNGETFWKIALKMRIFCHLSRVRTEKG